ncbi:hypothetical protein Ancab_002292, partial [Ancistrocladus abbreviatus]
GELTSVEEVTKQKELFVYARFLVKTTYLEIISESRTALINGEPFILIILEENFGGSWKHLASQTYKLPPGYQSSMEKESTPMMNINLKARLSFSHVSNSSEIE